VTSQRGYAPCEWEHFVSKRGEPQKMPDHFVLFGRTFAVEQWVELYDNLLRELAQRSPERFFELPDTPPFHSSATRTKRFTRVRQEVEDGHGEPFEFRNGALGPIYCKSSMWVKNMFENVCELLNLFGIPESEMVVYLREDSRAEEQEAGALIIWQPSVDTG
jgi:hypothetical protein